jgi:hypothetical protein
VAVRSSSRTPVSCGRALTGHGGLGAQADDLLRAGAGAIFAAPAAHGSTPARSGGLTASPLVSVILTAAACLARTASISARRPAVTAPVVRSI